MIHGEKQRVPTIGEIVIRGKWKVGMVEEIFPSRDGVARAVKDRVGKSHLEKAIQHLYPLGLFCDIGPSVDLNVQSEGFNPCRNAAEIARHKILDTFELAGEVPAVE